MVGVEVYVAGVHRRRLYSYRCSPNDLSPVVLLVTSQLVSGHKQAQIYHYSKLLYSMSFKLCKMLNVL